MKTLTTNPELALQNYLTSRATNTQKSALSTRQKWVRDNLQLVGFYPEFFGMVYARIESLSGKVIAMFFKGRASKPCEYTMFNTLDCMIDHAEQWANFESKRIAKKQATRSKKSDINIQDHLQMGDIFTCSWGYEVTYIDYYQVVGFKGKSTVLLREIAPQLISDNYNRGTCKPAINSFVSDEILQKRVNARICERGVFRASIKIDGYKTAFFEPKLENGDYCERHWSRDW